MNNLQSSDRIYSAPFMWPEKRSHAAYPAPERVWLTCVLRQNTYILLLHMTRERSHMLRISAPERVWLTCVLRQNIFCFFMWPEKQCCASCSMLVLRISLFLCRNDWPVSSGRIYSASSCNQRNSVVLRISPPEQAWLACVLRQNILCSFTWPEKRWSYILRISPPEQAWLALSPLV